MKRFFIFLTIVVCAGWTWYSFHPEFRTEPTLEAWMLDVGQGESVLVREPGGKLLLYDGGPDDSVLSQLGSVLPPWIHHLNMVILSHNHSDHIRGLISVLDRYKVDNVWVSGATYTSADYTAWLAALNRQHIHPKIVFAPFTDRFGQITLRVYHPLHSMEGQQPTQTHDATVSVKASYGDKDLFLTGDLNEQHEADMLAACQPPSCSLEAEVLQVPHHGSASGLSPEFLAAINPQYALIPVGKNNKFKHPRPNILQRLNDAQIINYRTDLNGRIHLAMASTGITVTPTIRAP